MNSIPRTQAEIRRSFIEFFASKGHTVVPSAPVAPKDDPTLMFTNAGMNQFKGIFLGDNPLGLKRAVDAQKCIRVSGKHNDLEEVGADHYHHTLFEMLGNWSFGDYYKREAISWAWELLTEVWKLPKERLFVTVYKDDDEAAEIWREVSGLAPERIMRFGDHDNFWEMGDTGPCGPCSEIHYDKGDLATQAATFADPVEGVNGQNARYMEIWNLVFMQYNRNADGTLTPLKAKHVDTGMGFERICSLLQGKTSNYATDIFSPIVDEIVRLSGVPYGEGPEGMPHRVIADHLRAVAFSVADGVMPSNDGRGYVIRRILRRACRYARNLGAREPFVCRLVPVLVAQMGDAYPEIRQRAEFVEATIRSEEERFIRTLDKGLALFDKVAASAKDGTVDGAQAFVLYDTYGFPFDLTCLLARERGLTVDEKGFETAMAAQKERARASRKEGPAVADESGWTVAREGTGTEFLGYETDRATVEVSRWRMEEGTLYVVLSSTPFYAEMGGEVGETGRLVNDKIELKVVDTVKVNDLWIHKAKVVSGEPTPEAMALPFSAEPDAGKRADTRANHSATHLLQAALRAVLGDGVAQAGSRVDSEGLRFDFSHDKAMTPEQIAEVERLVNEKIRENIPVVTAVKAIDEAKAEGATALFGEKYGAEVRVVTMGSFSKELCGGLHARSTGDVGGFRILSETARADMLRLQELQSLFKCKPEALLDRVKGLFDQVRDLEKETATLRQQLASQRVKALAAEASEVAGVKLLAKNLGALDKGSFSALVDSLAAEFDGVAVVACSSGESGSLAVTVAKPLVSRVQAGKLVSELAAVAGGKGGGRPDRAQAGAKNPEKLDEALAAAAPALQRTLA